ncbi:MAG: porin [Methylophilaceae bacterium]|nr:porin [Methylophilaceae bacterium]
MNIKLRRIVLATFAGSVMLGTASTAMADATFDLLQALVEKGVLTEEEAMPLMKSRANDEKKAKKDLDKQFPVKVGYDKKKGLNFKSDDGKFATNLQWRAQLRFTTPDTGNPQEIADFQDDSKNTFEGRRLRMKIGGHAYEPWLKYYFEVDLQPTRSVTKSSSDASTRVIDWRADVAKYDFATLRLGQWKINYNRERVDSSGKQQFVERSIVNDIFTIDRQVGAQLTGRLFKETPADMNYWAGLYTGEGRGVANEDNNLMRMVRLQWNPFGRELKFQQTDVEFTEKPTASISLAAAQNTGRCTRWSSSGCGNLDGFLSATSGKNQNNLYDISQWQQGSAFKYRGFSWQQEYHVKDIDNNETGVSSRLTGGYAQAGYFLIPKRFELAARYAQVKEPNATNILIDNKRKEYTVGANLFLFDAGHNNKITADFSRLTIDDGVLNQSDDENRFRLQWDVTF